MRAPGEKGRSMHYPKRRVTSGDETGLFGQLATRARHRILAFVEGPGGPLPRPLVATHEGPGGTPDPGSPQVEGPAARGMREVAQVLWVIAATAAAAAAT